VKCSSDGVDHHSFERSLSELADEQPSQELLFVERARRKQASDELGSPLRRTRAFACEELVETLVELTQG
jgi:hypothetical protein